MNKPQKPWPPNESEYWEKIERRYIYSCLQSLNEDDYYEEDEGGEEEVKPIEKVDLGWLLTQIPKGIKPEQIKIEFGYNASSMAYEDHYVRFYYEVTVPARFDEYLLALKKYEEAAKQYKTDLAAYEKVCHDQEIKETEEKLARLKGKK